MKQQNGFSLIEMLISMAVVSTIIGGVMTFTSSNQQAIKHAEKKLNDIMEYQLISLAITKDLTYSKYSFGFLQLTDDKGRNFYDYIHDGHCSNNCTRQFTLDAEKDVGKEFFILTQKQSNSVGQLITPELCYNNSYTFISLNKDDLLTKMLDEHGNSVPNPYTIWKADNLILLSSELRTRPVGSSINTPSYLYGYLGWVDKDHIQGKLKKVTFAKYFIFKNYITNKTIDSEDSFFQNLPFIFGIANYSSIRKVNFISYLFENKEINGKQVPVLMRREYLSQGVTKERMISKDIKKLTISREDIASTVLNFTIDEI